MVRAALALSLFTIIGFHVAIGDDQLTPLAEAGDWVAVSHSDSITDPADMCLAMAPAYDFALRTDENDTEIRYGNKSWSLPANVTGSLKISVNGHSYSYDITENSNVMVGRVPPRGVGAVGK